MKINKAQFIEKYREHQDWLEDNREGKRLVWDFEIDFKFEFDFNLDLSFANLSFANLSSANLRFANLRFANLSSANLSSSDLSSSDLSYANLRSSDLSYANLRSANLSSSDLRSSDLRSSDLDYSSWNLSCKTKDVVLCKKLQAQLLGHVMNVSPEIVFTKEQVQFVKDNWPRFEEFCNEKIKGLLV